MLVENLVPRLTPVDAEQKIARCIAVPHPAATAHIFALERVPHLVATLAVRRVVTELALAEEKTIHAVFGTKNPRAVVTVLALDGTNDQVTVLHVSRMIAVIAVLVVAAGKRDARRAILQFEKLREKGFLLIERGAIVFRIPSIAPITRSTVHGERNVGRILREDRLFAFVTIAMKILSLIAKCQAPLLTAGGAKRGWGNGDLLSAKDGRDLLVKGEIVLGDLEGRAAV